MRCYTWNVNGIRSVARKNLLPWDVCEGADVIGLQEIKATSTQLEPALSDPPGWHSFWHSAVKPGYSGVALICRDKPDEVVTGMGVQEFDDEGRVIAARFGTLVVVSAYFPNSRDAGARIGYKLAFCAAMERFLDGWRARGCEVCLMGDYNIAHQPIDLARPKQNEKNAGYLPEEREWMDRYLLLGYRDVFRERNPELAGAYTWWTNWANARGKNIGWRIDYCTVSSALAGRVSGSAIHPTVMGSDHCPVSIDIS
ncbi:MAG: exodeoxyribonuclease III [Planctomycetes bacterium]|nr:exodeoxyribonuclease III [Planctomycetota bacterium]